MIPALTIPTPPLPVPARRSRWRRYELSLVGGVFFALVIFATAFAPLLTPYNPELPNVTSRFKLPSLQHPFGTDDFGRDVLARVLYGGRPILFTGFASVLAALVVGILIGTVGALYRGWIDLLLMRLMDVMLSFPSVLLAILIVAALGTGLANMIVAITFFMVPVFARLVRAIVLTLVYQDYVLAARAMGAGDLWLIRRHIFPNLLPPMIVQASAMLAVAISTATALNFLRLGVEPPTPDWGLMVADGQRLLFDAAHVPFFPGLAITLTLLSVNFIGDGLRDHLDPKLRRRL
ncbi:MAG: ABC transporter permease [Anaerolineae bacterium]|nr:ABC transporter permease [Anaerolineae bacterium]